MMVVIDLILVLATFALPIYQSIIVHARETVLRGGKVSGRKGVRYLFSCNRKGRKKLKISGMLSRRADPMVRRNGCQEPLRNSDWKARHGTAVARKKVPDTFLPVFDGAAY
jgi:hypothetical protein